MLSSFLIGLVVVGLIIAIILGLGVSITHLEFKGKKTSKEILSEDFDDVFFSGFFSFIVLVVSMIIITGIGFIFKGVIF